MVNSNRLEYPQSQMIPKENLKKIAKIMSDNPLDESAHEKIGLHNKNQSFNSGFISSNSAQAQNSYIAGNQKLQEHRFQKTIGNLIFSANNPF